MCLSRTLTQTVGRMLIGVVLFAQFAVASYACPGLQEMMLTASASSASVTVSATATDSETEPATDSAHEPAAMPPGCGQMDPDAPNLCAEHCRQGQQSADTAAAPMVGLSNAVLLYSIPLEAPHSAAAGQPVLATGVRLDATSEPPHAILHCVFRI